MKNSLTLEGKNYISARRASEVFGYAQDYVGQLCRGGKLDCTMVGRSWFVTEESIRDHIKQAEESIHSNSLPAISPIVVIPDIKLEIRDEIKQQMPEVSESSPALAYEHEVGSALPVIIKKVPEIFSQPMKILNSGLVSNSSAVSSYFGEEKKALSALFIALVILGGASMLSLSSSINVAETRSEIQASVASVTKDIADRIASGFRIFADDVLAFFRQKVDNVNSRVSVKLPTTGINGMNGMVVIPSANLGSTDDKLVKEIKDSFSDEVFVQMDGSKTAGVITPVFRKVTGDKYIYVMVPVKNN